MDNKTYLTFTIDNEEMIQWLNDAVKGLKIGESKKITLSPEDAYGADTIEADMKDFQSFIDNGISIVAGKQIKYGQGFIDIVDVQGDIVTIKNPHPLAGKTLHFEIKLANFKN